MTHELDDDPLKQLEAVLSVTPTPEFAARVRERVRQEPARVSWGWWSLAAAGVAAVVIVGASVTVWRHESKPAAVVAATTQAPSEARVASPPYVAPTELRSAVAADQNPVRATYPGSKAAPARPAVVRASLRLYAPEVLVPDDQRRALNRLLVAIREGRAVVPAPGVRALEDEEGNLLEPRPIEIPLLKSIELLPGTPVDRSGSKDK